MNASPPAPPRAARSSALPVVAAIGGWVLLLVVTAGRIRDEMTATLFRDEAIAWTYADLPLRDIPEALGWDVNPPVYFVALHAWLSGGAGDTYLRVLSVVAILAAAAVSFDAARRLGGARAGWLASAFVLLAPGSLALAGLARPYAIAFLLGTIALDAAIVLVKTGRWPALAIFSVAGALLPLTHYWGGLLLAALLGALAVTALHTNQRWILSRTMIATGIVLVVFLPWAPTLAAQLGNQPLAAHQVPTAELLGRTLTLSAGGRVTAWVVGLGLLLIAAMAFQRRRTGRAAETDPGHLLLVTTMVAATGAVLLLWAISQVRPLFSPNYAFIVMAPLATVVGVYLSRRWWMVAAVLASLAFVAVPDLTRSAFADPAVARDSRGPEYAVATSLARTTEPGDVIVTSPGRVLAIRYYLGPDRDYVTPIGRVVEGRFDYRDRVERLGAADAAVVVDRLSASAPGTRIAFVHDIGPPFDHPYWIALDDAMDEIGAELSASDQLDLISTAQLPGPSDGIAIDVFEVLEP
jgi:hypothetical protein